MQTQRLHFYHVILIVLCFFLPEQVIAHDGNSAPVTLNQELKYAYNFEKHSSNFTGIHYVFQGTTDQWIVFVNFHTDMILNTTDKFDPQKRTLQWQTPYTYAQKEIHHFTAIHDKLALLHAWSGGKNRNFATFVLVPPHSNLIFKFGLAAPQKDSAQKTKGGGIQLRMLNIPKGSIAVTLKLRPAFELVDVFKSAINTVEKDYPHLSPHTIFEAAEKFSNDSFNPLKVLHSYHPKAGAAATEFEKVEGAANKPTIQVYKAD